MISQADDVTWRHLGSLRGRFLVIWQISTFSALQSGVGFGSLKFPAPCSCLSTSARFDACIHALAGGQVRFRQTATATASTSSSRSTAATGAAPVPGQPLLTYTLQSYLSRLETTAAAATTCQFVVCVLVLPSDVYSQYSYRRDVRVDRNLEKRDTVSR